MPGSTSLVALSATSIIVVIVDAHWGQAAKYYEKAARKGHAEAQYNLGYAYHEGFGGMKDLWKAKEYYEKAASKGCADAQIGLGLMYYEGAGIERDVAKAIYLQHTIGPSTSHRLRLKKYFDFTQTEEPNNRLSAQELEEMRNLQNKILKNWQEKYVQKTLNRADASSLFSQKSYLSLTQLMAEFINWTQHLGTKVGLMLTHVTFQKPEDADAINAHQQRTGKTPYVKEHLIKGCRYISFGEENVQIAEKIAEEVTSNNKYKSTIKNIHNLQVAGQEACKKAVINASFIEEKLHLHKTEQGLYKNPPVPGEAEEVKIAKITHKIARENKLYEVFDNQIKTLEEEKAIFDKYYKFFIKLVTKPNKRNEAFRRENDYLF